MRICAVSRFFGGGVRNISIAATIDSDVMSELDTLISSAHTNYWDSSAAAFQWVEDIVSFNSKYPTNLSSDISSLCNNIRSDGRIERYGNILVSRLIQIRSGNATFLPIATPTQTQTPIPTSIPTTKPTASPLAQPIVSPELSDINIETLTEQEYNAGDSFDPDSIKVEAVFSVIASDDIEREYKVEIPYETEQPIFNSTYGSQDSTIYGSWSCPDDMLDEESEEVEITVNIGSAISGYGTYTEYVPVTVIADEEPDEYYDVAEYTVKRLKAKSVGSKTNVTWKRCKETPDYYEWSVRKKKKLVKDGETEKCSLYLKGLKAGTYSVRVRGYYEDEDGNMYYGEWRTAKFNVKTKVRRSHQL